MSALAIRVGAAEPSPLWRYPAFGGTLAVAVIAALAIPLNVAASRRSPVGADGRGFDGGFSIGYTRLVFVAGVFGGSIVGRLRQHSFEAPRAASSALLLVAGAGLRLRGSHGSRYRSLLGGIEAVSIFGSNREQSNRS